MILTVHIEDPRYGRVDDWTVGDWHECMRIGVLIGSAEDCAVRLAGKEVSAHHARYCALGHHRFINVLNDGDEVIFQSKSYRWGSYLRVDYEPFTIGPYTLHFGEEDIVLRGD